MMLQLFLKKYIYYYVDVGKVLPKLTVGANVLVQNSNDLKPEHTS